MIPTTRVAAVIPARMASSRFPGKPLLSIRGLPMVEHVRRRALLCEAFCDVVVATCDVEIAEAVRRYGGNVMMTSPAHPGATDRVAEAAGRLDCTHVVNVQGDEVLVLPEDLARLVKSIQDQPAGPAWNAIASIEEAEQLKDRSIVKCLVSGTNRILSCARDYSAAPLRTPFEPVRIILGILAYEKNFLLRFSALPRTPYETAESIDQSRVLEHDFILQGVPFARGYPGINEPRETTLVEKYLEEDRRQAIVLSRIVSAVPTPS